jgi:hypothetical protein
VLLDAFEREMFPFSENVDGNELKTPSIDYFFIIKNRIFE